MKYITPYVRQNVIERLAEYDPENFVDTYKGTLWQVLYSIDDELCYNFDKKPETTSAQSDKFVTDMTKEHFYNHLYPHEMHL